MAKRNKPPELTFQQHIADYLVREHGYGVLEQGDITDPEHCIAEDQLWAFLKATQADTLKKLADDYGTDARDEVFKALRKELAHTPLWLILRNGLEVRARVRLQLFYPKPRSDQSAAHDGYPQNRITFRPHFYFGKTNKEIDFVFFLNGLPVVALELKHEANQTVHDAVAQFAVRDHTRKIFQHPFLYLAADTCDVMAATDPRREENFRWHNTGLTNTPQNPDEYPVEFLYREVLSKEHLLEALSFFLVRVPEREAEDDKPARPAFTLFPRYHQSRLVQKISADISAHFAATGGIGKKYLADHSAGSGKTLSICWLADRLHSLFKPGTNEKLVDITFIITDRKSLDTNIREDIANFTHLKDVVGLAKKSEDLPRFLKERRPIIVTTQQKFLYILGELQKNPALKALRVAFLIDEAHRSQEGQGGAAIRLPFRKADEPDADAPELDPEEQLAKVIREHDVNQLFVAFTATPAQATVDLFGESFDSYTEAEAIAEGYIVDVATSIISYKTLYHLHCHFVPKPDEKEKVYPKGVVSKALMRAKGSYLHFTQIILNCTVCHAILQIMLRQLRHHVPGGWYHIITRGLGRRTIFETDCDHEHFIELLGGMVERYSILQHAYVLLGNHYHLLIESPEGNVSRAMQWLNTSYSVWFNLKHSRAGALFQSRFKSIPVDNEGSWAFECAMYVHLNPVRIKALGLGKEDRSREKAGMLPEEPKADVILNRLETLRSHRWSSYPAYAGYVEKPSWLFCDELWRRGCDKQGADPKREYREWLEDYLKQGVEEKLFSRMTAAMTIGGTRFRNEVRRRVLEKSGERTNERQWRRMLPFSEVTKAVEQVAEEAWKEISIRRGGWARDLALCVGQKRCGLTLKELGNYTGMKQQAVCNAVARFGSRMEKDETMKELYYRVLTIIGDIGSC